jgi:hypothetical protein
MKELAGLLERFRRGAELVAATVSGISGAEADFSPAPGLWSARQIVAHLADSELVAAERIRRAIAEDITAIPVFDKHRWAAALEYEHRRIPDSLELLRAVRCANFELLRNQPEAAFARSACPSTEEGEITLKDLLHGATAHIEVNVKQIEQIREKYRDLRPKI